jgi:hypothetical protein
MGSAVTLEDPLPVGDHPTERLYSSLSLSTTTAVDAAESEENSPLRSPLSGMVANRKRVFESDC